MSTYGWFHDPDQALTYIQRCAAMPTWAVDSETTGLRKWHDTVVGICLSAAPGEGVYLPIAHDRGPNLPDGPWSEALTELLTSKPARWHNYSYDAPILGRYLCIEPSDILIEHDSMLAAQCIGERNEAGVDGSAGLKELAEKYMGVVRPAYKDLFPPELVKKGRKHLRFASLDPDVCYHYAAADADDTHSLPEVLMPLLDGAGVRGVYEALELAAAREVMWMESAGMRVDEDYCVSNAIAAQEFADEVKAMIWRKLSDTLGRPISINLGSVQQLQRLLFTPRDGLEGANYEQVFGKFKPTKKNPEPPDLEPGLGLPVTKRTGTGAPSTDESVLNHLAGQEPFVAWILEMRGALKMKGTYLDAFPEHAVEEDGLLILHPDYNQFGTETGRFSCSAPSVQNVPKSFTYEVPDVEEAA